jgi:hypothetical protein
MTVAAPITAPVVELPVAPATGIGLLDVDPTFARAVPEQDHDLARRVLALPEQRLEAGQRVACETPEHFAMLLVEGAIWRDVRVGRGASPQLLAPGGIVLCTPAPPELLAAEASAVALTPVRLAVLDRRFLLAAAKWPGLLTAMHDRLGEQERDIAIQAAICQLPKVEERVLALLWHLAERWGRVGGDGVLLPLRLTHATLGRFVGARRPTITLALNVLRDEGKVERHADGSWALHGGAPDFAHHAAPSEPEAMPELIARRAI